ncbi:MAG TPA: hypothetical protein VJX31_07420 [Casimicrobiaceae bacterium]|nr:hypothetical protein [Casimicrobiaceae bacterium]
MLGWLPLTLIEALLDDRTSRSDSSPISRGTRSSIRLVLFDVRTAIAIAIAALLPFVPIWLSAITLATVLDPLAGVLL